VRAVKDRLYLANGTAGLEILKVAPAPLVRPAFTSQWIAGQELKLAWNDSARGFTLQRSSRLADADWQDVAGSELDTMTTIPAAEGAGFFRLIQR
jgi:hypothetical protein